MSLLTTNDLDQLSATAKDSPRKRSHHNVHPTLEAPVQRLAIAMEPETYVRPHRHPQTWELYLPLRGQFKVILFDNNGTITQTLLLGGEHGLAAYELPANTWHAVLSLEPGSIIFEVKEGPYIQPQAGDVASWSPAEGDEGAAAFKQQLLSA